MAKSKNGGSRAYIRGRIGSDVYSVGKNGMGEKQQVVRSLAEQVANPRSQSQMFGRMIMSTVMQGVSALSQIIDHSFDGYPKGQPSISQFIKNNYALVKDDAVAHPASGNNFGLNKYQEKGIKAGKWLIADGNLVLPVAITTNNAGISITLSANALTVGDLKAALGLSADGFLTCVYVNVDTHSVEFFRAQLTTTLADSTTITSTNVGSLFTFEGNVTPEVELDSNIITIDSPNASSSGAAGIIVSEKIAGAWKHNRVAMKLNGSASYVADDALPTYPVGEQMFLNGGDL